MDLAKLNNDSKLDLCKWYFKVGFALLPFVWAVNVVWFFNEAFRKPEYDEQPQIRKYVILSGIGAVIWFLMTMAWVVTFQTHRLTWGDFADDLSFIVPLGS